MIPQQTLLFVVVGLAFLFVVFLILTSGNSSGGTIKKRLDRVSGTAAPKSLKETTGNLRRRTSDSEIPLLDRLIKTTLPNPEKMRARLAATGKNISLGEYLIINALCIVVAYLVFTIFAGWTKVIASFMAIAVGLYLPHMITGRMMRKRLTRFMASFPEAIDTICRGLRSGLPITETIATVGHELPDPIGIEFSRISDGVRMGRSLEESMWEVATRLDTPEYRFFIIALSIQRETGGNLAETLGNLGELLRKRRQLKQKIKAMSSEAKASAMIIGSLPFIMFSILYFVNPDYMSVLFNETIGRILLGGGLTWLGMGVFVMKQMINFEI